MQRTGKLQDITPAKPVPLNTLSPAELYAMHEKQRAKPMRLDMAGPTRITNSMMPNCTKPLFETPAHLTPDRIEASNKPRVEFGRRYYLCGRIEALDGTVIRESSQ